MRVEIIRPERPTGEFDACIVVDVLRATSTAAVLCDRLGELCAIGTPAELPSLPARAGGYALFSEISGIVSELPRFDNSPVVARGAELGARTPVLVTTNGTIAIGIAIKLAREVLLAGFVNLSAVVQYLRERAPSSVAILPAGLIGKQQRCIEDDGCAEALAARLSGAACDTDAILAGCRNDERIKRRAATQAGLAEDIALCFDIDAIDVVPRVEAAAGAGFAIRRS